MTDLHVRIKGRQTLKLSTLATTKIYPQPSVRGKGEDGGIPSSM